MYRALLVCLVVGVMACAACGGGGSAARSGGITANPGPPAADPDTSGSLAEGITRIPNPRDVSQSATLDESTRSYLVQIGSFYTSLQGEGSEIIEPQGYFRLLPKTDNLLAYDFASIQRIRTESSRPGHINLDLDWEAGTPSGDEGIYLGYADEVQNRWLWRGPIQGPGDLADLAALDVEAQDPFRFSDTLVLVNYSSSAVVIKHIYFTAINAADTVGDEQLYYVQYDSQSAPSIVCAPAAELESAQVIVTGEPFEMFERLEVVELDHVKQLVFSKFTKACQWEVWQANLDGTGLKARHAEEFASIQHSSFSEDMTQEFCYCNDFMGNSTLQQYDTVTGALVDEFDLLTSNGANPVWYNRGGYQCRMLTSVPEWCGLDTWGLVYYLADDLFGGPKLYPIRMMSSGESITDPSVFYWASDDTFSNEQILYSYKPNAEADYSVVLFHTHAAGLAKEQPFMAQSGADLRFPQMSPDQLQFSVIAMPPGWARGTLYVMPAYARSISAGIPVAHNVASSMWYDPTPPVWEH